MLFFHGTKFFFFTSVDLSERTSKMEGGGSLQQSNALATTVSELPEERSERTSTMEGGGSQQQSNASATTVFELPGEPAIVINGVPDIIPSDSTRALCKSSSTVEAPVHSGLGEWLEGREVLKLFMGRYYTGVVLQYDKLTGWFRVLYEDGDSEDLDWQELEEILLPLDVTIPLKSLAQRIVCRKYKKPINKSGKTVSNSQNPQVKRTPSKGKMTTLLYDGASNQ